MYSIENEQMHVMWVFVCLSNVIWHWNFKKKKNFFFLKEQKTKVETCRLRSFSGEMFLW